MAKSGAERMKALCKRRAEADPNYKSKESKRISELQTRKRAAMTEDERKIKREEHREKVREWRRKRMESGISKALSVPKVSFRSPQSLGKAVRGASRLLPTSPSKKRAVVFGLAKRYGMPLQDKMESALGAKKNWKALSEEVKVIVKDFYYRSDNVWTAPGMKDQITVWVEGKKEKMRKYFLTMYLKELFALFQQENPEICIGFSKFASLRPQNVLLLKDQSLDQCKCHIHENFRLKQVALNIHADKFWEKMLCHSNDLNSACWRGVCSDCQEGTKFDFSDSPGDAEEVNWMEWKKDENGRLFKAIRTCCVGELKELLLNSLPHYQEHVRVKRIMAESFEEDKSNPRLHVLQVDFAMAYSCEYQDEVQSALWSRQSVNLFTASVFGPSGECSSNLIVTDSSDKGKDSVLVFLLALIKEIDFAGEEELVIYSDGPSSEFKNKYITGKVLPLIAEELGRPVSWKYFATAHGKGVVDGIGGAAKAKVRERIRSKGKDAVIVQSADDFAEAVSNLLPQVHTQLIKAHEIQATVAERDPWVNTQDIPGIKKIHVSRAEGGTVKMWHTSMDINGKPVITIKYDINQSNLTSTLKIGDWVLVKYDGMVYPGEVTNKKGKDTEVNVMVQASKTTWKWPLKADKIFYKPENIEKKIQPPQAPCSGQGRMQFTFSDLF